MTPEPLTAVLDQLATCREHLSDLDAREASHFAGLSGQITQLAGMVTTISRALADDTAALARLDALDRQVSELAQRLPGPGGDGDGDGCQPRPAPAWWKLTPDGRRAPVAEMQDWVEHVYRPGYGHLAALAPCWPEHDLCLYALDIASQLWCALYLHPDRGTSLLSAQAEYQVRILPALAAQMAAETTRCGHHPAVGYPRSTPVNPVLRQALACAARGLPVFPCQPGRKTPATRHGHLDATTDLGQIDEWFGRHPERNLAVATGAPGPDVLDIDQRGHGRSGYPALARLSAAGLLAGASGKIRTPSGGLHVYFAGSSQRSGHLPACHVDFLSGGGYVLIPPSQVDGRPYQHIATLPGRGGLDWDVAVRLLDPSREHARPAPRRTPGEQIDALARWVAAQPVSNRNNGLFWAANRALEADQAADLSPLAVAARQAGLTDPEITRTLNSARRTSQAHPLPPSHQAEGTS